MINDKPEEIKYKAKQGIFWSFTEKAGTQILAFVIGVIMTRILLPSDYGIIALLEILASIGLIISNFGLGQSYIINAGSDKEGSTVFITNMAISSALYLVIYLSAPYLALYYNITSLELLIKVFCLNLPLQTAGMFYQFVLIRKFELKILTIIKVVSLLIAGISGIYFAVAGYGVWALVVYFNSYFLLNLILLIIFSGWKPLWSYNLTYLKTQIKKASEIASTDLIDILYTNFVTYCISRTYSMRITGFYSKSRTIQNTLVTSLQQLMQSVSLPLLAILKGNSMELVSAFRKQIRMLSYFTSMIFGIIFLSAEPFVEIVFTAKWIPMVPYFKLLSILSWIMTMQYLHSTLLITLGRSRLNLVLESIKKLSIIVSLMLVITFGVEYVILAQIVLLLPGLLVNIGYTFKLIHYPVRQQLPDHFSTVGLMIVTGLIISLISVYIESQIVLLSITVLGSLLIYISVGYITGISEHKQIQNIINSVKRQSR